MDGLAIAASLVEVRRAAEGAIIRSIHEPEPGSFLVGVFGAGNHAILLSPRAASLHVTRLAYRNPERPSSFVMQLRKHLRGARITRIRQSGWDRSVELIGVRNEGGHRTEASLVVELTGLRGNVLLLNGGRTVLGALRQDPRNPTGHLYAPLPEQPKSDPRTVALDALAQILASDIPARALARALDGVGRRTSEDLVAMASALGRADEPLYVKDALEFLLSCVDTPRPYADPLLGVATFYPPRPGAVEAEGAHPSSFGDALDLIARRSLARRNPQGPTQAGTSPRTAMPREVADATMRAARDGLLAAIGRASRTQRALAQWLEAAKDAPEMRRRADFLLLHAADIGRGTTRVAGLDPASGVPVTFPVVARMNGMENAQALYKKARKLDRGRPTVQARLERIDRELVRLQTALADLDAGHDVDESLLEKTRARATQKTVVAPSGPRRFDIEGFVVLVGRSAAQNDELMRRARPDDLWLHARDVAGSHVVVCRKGEGEIPRTVLEEAARLAARYSKGDRRGKVAVVWTEARHVRKPRRGAPGLAIVTNESTLTVELTDST